MGKVIIICWNNAETLAILTWKFKMYFFNPSDVYFLFRNLIKSIIILIALNVFKFWFNWMLLKRVTSDMQLKSLY